MSTRVSSREKLLHSFSAVLRSHFTFFNAFISIYTCMNYTTRLGLAITRGIYFKVVNKQTIYHNIKYFKNNGEKLHSLLQTAVVIQQLA